MGYSQGRDKPERVHVLVPCTYYSPRGSPSPLVFKTVRVPFETHGSSVDRALVMSTIHFGNLFSSTVYLVVTVTVDDRGRGQSKNCLICDSLSVVSHNEQRDLQMARLPRLSLASIPQHVIQLGNNRQPCFYTEEDYRFYLECLGAAARKYRVSVHAYVLMTNHVHLLMTPTLAAGTS
jgi:Transposase and inactivated derivatives